jgi:hypothetical protein
MEDPKFGRLKAENLVDDRIVRKLEKDGASNDLGSPDSFEQPSRRNPPGLHRFRQMLVDLRDAVQKEIARGATEDQAAVNLS